MKLASTKSVLWPAVVCGLAAILILLGVLQYRWSTQISEATTARMRAGLTASMLEFRRSLFREFSTVARAFESSNDEGSDFRSYTQQLAEWRGAGSHSALVENVYVWPEGRKRSQLLKINTPGKEPEPLQWPAQLLPLREEFPISVFHQRFSGPRPEMKPPRYPERVPEPGLKSRPPNIHFETGVASVHQFSAIRAGSPWMLIPSVPALVRPLLTSMPVGGRAGLEHRGKLAGWVIITLNRAFLKERLLPELAARYFSGTEDLDYDVAVVAGEQEPVTIFSTDPKGGKTAAADADAGITLFAPFPGSPRAFVTALPQFRGQPQLGPASESRFAAGTRDRQKANLADDSWDVQIPPFASPADHWRLMVNNRQGSVEVVVARLRRRNLAVSFGVLALLGATMGIIILATRRAQELARLQLEFVAGVSHELRTPLTVISSAADNIADGLVQGEQQIAQYGVTLKRQSAQLRDLVEQILLFATTQQNRQPYLLKPVQVADAVDLALENSAELIRDARCVVECRVRRDLPESLVDVQALARCLQNLIANAIKYGGESRWLGIDAKAGEDEAEVVINVEDRGIGIQPDDLPHVFEPFYRCAAARHAQIHGNGLGLSVAKNIVDSMGGCIVVQSSIGRGSLFSVHVPASRGEAAQREMAVHLPAKVNIS